MLKKAALALSMFTPLGAAYATDLTQTFLTTPNFPLQQALPVNPAAVPGGGLRLVPGSTNAFFLKMGTMVPGANVTTGQAVRDTFFMNYIVGNLSTAIGCPMDTGQGCGNSPFNAVARHYAVGDPNDLHVVEPDGLHLRAICSNNHTDCTMGNVYGAMIRVPFEIRPNMTVKVRYKAPVGPYAWTPIWLFSGSEISPGPNGQPWSGFDTQYSLVQEPVGGQEFEIDMNDMYPRWYNSPSVPMGHQLNFLTPNIYGVQWNTAPHWVYGATTGGNQFYPNGGPEFEATAANTASGFHSLVLSWDGAQNMLYEFVDGQMVASIYMEYAQAPTYYDGFTGTTKVQAMHLIIGNQAIPTFTPGYSNAHQENDGIPDGWTIVVREIAAWYGTVANPTGHEPR